MGKKYEYEEVNPEENMVSEPILEYGIQPEAEIENLPTLTEEEEKDLITGEELLDAVCKHIHELFNKK